MPMTAARWLELGDTALSRGADEENVPETEVLARKEQAVIKRRIRRGRTVCTCAAASEGAFRREILHARSICFRTAKWRSENETDARSDGS